MKEIHELGDEGVWMELGREASSGQSLTVYLVCEHATKKIKSISKRNYLLAAPFKH